MSTVKTILYTCVVLFFHKISFTQNTPPEISVSGNQLFCPDAPMSIVTAVNITDADVSDTTLNTVVIQISEGYVSGQDLLTLIGVHPSISGVWNVAQGKLSLNGPATFAEFETAISSVVFSTTQTVLTTDKAFSINLGNANFLPTTGHYYFYVSDVGIGWTAAKDAAATQTYFGLQGYLATLTTIEEAQLAGEQNSGAGWIGATDAQSEGTWQWVTGPEAGNAFFNQNTGTAINGEFSFWNTNEPNNFNGNEDYAHITDPSIGILGSWNDLPEAGETNTNSAFHPKGYVVEFGGMPGDPTINLSGSSRIIAPQIQVTNQDICLSQSITLIVTSNANEVLWFDSQTSNTVINTGNSYEVTPNADTTYWVQPNVTGCTSGQRTPVSVTVNTPPNFQNINVQQCENEAVFDGISLFNLSFYNANVADNITTNRTITYYEDAALTQSISSTNYSNTTNNQIIFAKVEATDSGCFSIAQLTLSVWASTLENFELITCDDATADGFTNFNLSDINTEVLLGFPPTATTSFYQNYNDALLQQNILPTNFTNTTAFEDSVFVKITENNRCLGIAEVLLSVNALPIIKADETVLYCLNTFPETLTLTSGNLETNPNNYAYLWSTGETTMSININTVGTYTVSVTSPGQNSCTSSRSITVLPSNTATIDGIEVTDASLNNSILVLVSGEGDFVYALNNENGPYQTSNIFENVASGIYTVYVKDIKNNCGIVSEAVSVIGFPKFFTPNNDTVNDIWQLNGFSAQFPVDYTVKIFDRYGKLITTLNQNKLFWDGTYNGLNLPQNDYWFEIQLADGRIFRDHFTLRR